MCIRDSSYINLRPLFAFGLTPSIEILFGGTISYSLKRDREINVGGSGSIDLNDDSGFWDSSDFRFALNAGFGFPMATSFGVVAPRIMYEYALTKDLEERNNSAGAEVKTSAIQFGLDIFF